MMTLLETVQQIITQQRLLPPDSKLVIGVSGGPDSLALLHVLQALGPSLKIELHVATLDHGLRGADGAADLRFVADLCQQWDIAVTTETMKPEALNTQDGIEKAARVVRYAFLARVAHTIGATHIAVAHHADDQAETILMHLLRGAGLQGLAGMVPSGPLPDYPEITLIRPLLSVSRQTLIDYCQQHGLQPRIDASNQDTRLLRNRLRLETLPYLRQINPQIDRALRQMAAIATTNQNYIQQQLNSAITGHITSSENRLQLSRGIYEALHPALQQQFIWWATGQLSAETTSYDHITTAAQFAHRGQTGQRMALPGKLWLRLDYEQIIVEKQSTPRAHLNQPHLVPGAVVPLQVPGLTPLPDSNWSFVVSETSLPEGGNPQLRLNATLQPAMVLRTRQAGDRFAPLGLGGHTQKIKKWMVDHKVPQAQRDQIPLLVIAGEIAAFLVGNQWVINEHFAPTETDQTGLYFQFIEETPLAD